MSTFPNSPRLLKGGLVLLNPETSAVERIIVMQYNPDTLTRSFQVKGGGAEGGDRSEPLRLKGPPVETIKLDAEIDATDQLEMADGIATQVGIHPQLAAIETLLYPASGQLIDNNAQLRSGMLEIVPMQAPLTIFVWSPNRVVPVRITELSVTEEAFDTNLNPLRAKVSLGMRVLSVDDLGFDHRGGDLYMVYQKRKELLSTMSRRESFGTLGIRGI